MNRFPVSSTYSLPEPEVSFGSDETLRSNEYGDIYFPQGFGPEAALHVFCKPNGLPERWRQRRTFVIGELGFGTGLNFFVTANLWMEAPKSSQGWLRFISFENRPLSPDTIRRALTPYPALRQVSERLLQNLPAPILGLHRIQIPGARITLDLYYGDALSALQSTSFFCDAWYLDGFSPSKNPTLWSELVFHEIAAHSRDGTTFGTFSSSGSVRRALEEVGFSVEKFNGFREKRESLRGVFHSSQQAPPSSQKRIAVVGAGLAGCSLAYSLSRYDAEVVLFEQESGVAAGASGNPAGVLLPYISRNPTAASLLYLLGFEYSLRLISELRLSSEIPFDQCGVAHFPSTRRLELLLDELESLEIPPQIASSLAHEEMQHLVGQSVVTGGFYYPRGAWCNPSRLCEALLEGSSSKVSLKLDSAVYGISKASCGWNIAGPQGKLFEGFSHVIFANAASCRNFSEASWLPINSVRGQIAFVPSTARSKTIRPILCYDGYLLPTIDGRHVAGATYDHDRHDRVVSPEQNKEIVKRTRRWVPELDLPNEGLHEGRASFRTSTFDRLPIVGALPNVSDENFDSFPGLFVSIGFGSRGLISIPLLADILASEIVEGTSPLPASLRYAVSPVRCLKRYEKKSRQSSSKTER